MATVRSSSGRYPAFCAAFRTCVRIRGDTGADPLSTRDTVAGETPASFAMTRTVAFIFPPCCVSDNIASVSFVSSALRVFPVPGGGTIYT